LKNRLTLAASVLGLLAASALALKFAPAPFIWIPLLWAMALFVWGFRRRHTTIGIAVFNVAYVALAFAGVETWLQVQDLGQIGVVRTYAERYQERHPYLGSRPRPSVVERATAMYGDELVYDVEYTIGENGLRLAPPVDPDSLRGCVLFFGGSFVYGEGIADTEALPYQVGLQSAGRFSVFNFGFHGHGAGQMLSALEHGYVDEAIDCMPSHAIYLGMESHVARLRGAGWMAFGPKYVADGNGGVTYRGLFRDSVRVNWMTRVIEPRARKSKLVSWVLDYTRPLNDEDFELFAAVVEQTAEAQRTKYPGIESHMLVWDDWESDDSGVGDLERLSRGLDGIHRASAILPQFDAQPQLYRIHERDWHPNALADRLLAAYIVSEILER